MHGFRYLVAFASLAFLCAEAQAQVANQSSQQQVRDWAIYASVYTYFVPDDVNYVQPTIAADWQWLHLEARYNYEDLRTGSAWLGYNFSFGKTVSLSLTPMVGGVFGRTAGIAPGYEATLDWRRFQLSSESEWVRNTRERKDSFFYTWSEATAAPLNWLQAGFVVQRTRVYQSDRDVQRGFLVRLLCGRIDVTAHLFNPDEKKPLLVISADVEF